MRLQNALAAIDYSTQETNFTLALADLRTRLSRRSLVVVATELRRHGDRGVDDREREATSPSGT